MKMISSGSKVCISLVLAVILLTSLSGCEVYDSFAFTFLGKTIPDDIVRIAVFEPLSGKDKAYGELEKQGIELAHELYPTVLGQDVELIIADNRSDINAARDAAKSLTQKKVSFVLGSYRSTLSLAGGEIFNEYGLPAIAITNSNPLVTLSNDWYFRVCFVDSFQGVAMAKYAVECLNVTKAAIMKESDNDYANALSQAFSDKFTALTENPDSIVYVSEFPKDTLDYSGELSRISNAGAGVVFVPLDADTSVRIAKQADKTSFSAIFLGTNLWERENLTDLANEKVLSGMSFSSDYGQTATPSALSVEFYKAYKEKYGTDNMPDPAVVLGFDAYMLALDTMERAGSSTDYEDIRGQLIETRSFPGVSGNISFDENGDTIKSVSIMSVRDNGLTTVYVAEPNWGSGTSPAAIEP